MKAKSKTTYVAASPQTWELIRAAYLSGLSAPTAAARFGVSVTALRKRAAREGWTKRAYARACAPPAVRAHEAAAVAAPQTSPPDDIALRVEAIVARQMVPLFEEPTVMARRALGQAQRSISEGRGLEAVRLVKAARELHELDGYLPSARYLFDEEDERDYDGRREQMRVMVRSLALTLADKLVAGEPLPAEFQRLREMRGEDLE